MSEKPSFMAPLPESTQLWTMSLRLTSFRAQLSLSDPKYGEYNLTQIKAGPIGSAYCPKIN